MAVPKRKTSKARRNARASANVNIKVPAVAECPHCHESKVSHEVCPKCGFYNGEQIIAVEEKKKK